MKVQELKESIREAVAELDQADGSRTGMTEAIDTAREILSDAYGADFEQDVQDFISSQDDSEDGLDAFDQEIDEE